MAEPYIPLFTSTIRSSLWSLSGDTIKVFLTLALESDPEGFVSASAEGIRRLADLPLNETLAHLALLEAPDLESKDLSRAQGATGARIERVENGWRVINIEWYREHARRQSELFRKRRWWNEKGDAARRDARRTDTETETETYTDTEREDVLSSPAEPAPDSIAIVRTVFDEWRKVHAHPGAKLDPKRTARIRAALKSRTPDELCQAIRGALKDDWLMGRDPKSPRKYDELHTILRDAAQIERLIDLETGKTQAKRIGGGSRQPDCGLTGFEKIKGARG